VVKLSDLKAWEDVLEEALDDDPALRGDWEDSALAREVALRVLAFRTKNGLSQAAFGKVIGVSQPRVATIESGEHEPSISTLKKLANALEIEFAIDITPSGQSPRLLKKTGGQRAIRGGQLTVATSG
jgi:ribosome-binding protein aMBF1 (putative translation factor)